MLQDMPTYAILIVLIAVPLLVGYLLGSIPFGLLLTKFAGMGDIRTIGSGNIGATNVLRTGKKGLAAFTLLLDGGKGVLAVFMAAGGASMLDSPNLIRVAMCVAALSAVLGHMFPIWLRFRGGKGVATALGVFTALAWPVGVACMVTWLAVAAVFRFSSLSALVAMALAPLYALFWAQSVHLAFAGVIAVLVIAKHHVNIRRLLKGEEPRIGKAE
jgi:glycerol-3-phosphate acyltransferase PlsY